VLVDLSPPSQDDAIQHLPHGVDRFMDPFGVHMFRERRKAGQVGHEDDQLMPLRTARFRLKGRQFLAQRQ